MSFSLCPQHFNQDFHVQKPKYMDKSSLWAELGIVLNMCTWFKLPALICFFTSPVVIALQVYYWVLISNLVLRCTWTYKLSSHLRHNYLTVFAITALEMLRRFQWVFFRVENEWNKMTAKQNFEMSSDMPSEADRLLESSSHTVWIAGALWVCESHSSYSFMWPFTGLQPILGHTFCFVCRALKTRDTR
jgi:hypothetical protein